MAEIWDIARYVEANPEDHDQRWRLVKKLYSAWEYRLALEHLQVLKEAGVNRLNVLRYLGATYYRLGRYDEAVSELEQAIATWPNEVGLREQLARVLEVAGNRERAAEAWAEISEIDPQHPIAGSAVRRLSKRADDTPVRDLQIEDSDSGIDLRPGRVCPNCGAQNSEEFDRCWQCHASLVGPNDSGRIPVRAPAGPLVSEEWLLLGLGGGAVVALALGVFMALRLVFVEAEPGVLIASVWDVWQYRVAGLRVALGAVALVAWPLALWAALYCVRPPHVVPPSLVNFSAVATVAVAYLGTWLQRDLIFLAPVLPLATSLALILGFFRLGAVRAFLVWGLHLGILVAVFYGALIVIERVRLGEYFNPITEMRALVAYVGRDDAQEADGAHAFPEGRTPYRYQVRWGSTGSRWLDVAAGDVEFRVVNATRQPDLRFEISSTEGTLVFDDVEGEAHVRRYRVEPGTDYTVVVSGPVGVSVRVLTSGLLIPSLKPE